MGTAKSSNAALDRQVIFANHQAVPPELARPGLHEPKDTALAITPAPGTSLDPVQDGPDAVLHTDAIAKSSDPEPRRCGRRPPSSDRTTAQGFDGPLS
ncbi:hypothetical protein GCM10023346_10750 [Arthrobacter gyeryongensis]|uniref:Uncharacterized protein n=1 Tax=Arthrobacter gyeryongensis TaxID=1650592 RepID=A0ABP9S4L7_9MICC